MTSQPIAGFSDLTMASALGIAVIQVMDFYADELKISEESLQIIWAPFFASALRLTKKENEIEEMVEKFNCSAKSELLNRAIKIESTDFKLILQENFPLQIIENVRKIGKEIYDYGYAVALQNPNSINKNSISEKLIHMLTYYLEHQGWRDVEDTDKYFIEIISSAITTHIEDTCLNITRDGVEASKLFMDFALIFFSGAYVLYSIEGYEF